VDLDDRRAAAVRLCRLRVEREKPVGGAHIAALGLLEQVEDVGLAPRNEPLAAALTDFDRLGEDRLR